MTVEDKVVIVIEGNIGSGKTTLGKVLEKKFNLKLYRELVNPNTLNMLNDFYNDKKRYAFLLQIHFLNERFKMIKDIFKNKGGILDRSIYGDKVFASVLKDDENMSENEFRVYSDLLENMLEHVKKPRLLIFLDANVNTCLDRIKKRDRLGEELIQAEYLLKLENKYKEWLDSYKLSPKIILPYDKLNIFSNEEEVINLISPYIQDLQPSL